MSIYVKKSSKGVIVGNEYFEVLHSKKDGGAWASLVFKKGSGKNLLARPMSSHFKFRDPVDPKVMYNSNFAFQDILDTRASLSVTQAENGDVTVTACGQAVLYQPFQEARQVLLPAALTIEGERLAILVEDID